MSARLHKVEQLLRRELATALARGELRDPRVEAYAAAISITGVRVAPDLGSAVIFVDVLGEGVNLRQVLSGLNAGAPALRRSLGHRIHLKRTPSLRFQMDDSIAEGTRIEQVILELEAQRKAQAAEGSEGLEPEGRQGEEPGAEAERAPGQEPGLQAEEPPGRPGEPSSEP